jgi:flagellar biosynthetic protein FlhB
MADDFGDKTEAPTPRRRSEAREQGNIARSPDLTAAVLLIAVLIMLSWYGPNLVTVLKNLMAEMLGGDGVRDPRLGNVFTEALFAVRLVAGAMAPLLIGVVVVAILTNLFQVGFFFSFQRVQPNLGGLNPAKGLSKLFNGRDNLIHLAMSVVKLALVSFVAYSAVHGKLAAITQVQQLDFVQIFGLGAQLIYSIGIRIGMILLLLAFIDYAYQRWRNEQDLKMSKQEIKEEMRSMEGDPKIKNRRRQIAMQRVVQGIKKNVPTADVIVTNPTEFAVALKYDPQAMHAPRVVAKGTDYLAMRIREIAIEHGVPILERPPLARALYRLVDIGHEIPEQFYSAVAEILAYVYELSGKLKQRKREFAAN